MVRRVLVVDDHDDVRAAIVTLLTADGFAVVGEAANAEQALTVARREGPGVVLLDIRLPGPDGFAVARELSCLSPAPTVVLMSSREAGVYGTGEDATGTLGDLPAQTRQAIRNIASILADHGGALADVVRMTCYLADINHFALFDAAYSTALGRMSPARTTVGTTGLPAGELVEIEATAYIP